MTNPLRKGAWQLWNLAAGSAARSYIAGPELQDAAEVCLRLSGDGFGTTLGYWNRKTEEDGTVADAYLAAIELVGASGSDSLVSIKLPGLHFSCERLQGVLTAAKKHAVQIRVDSLAHDTVDRTQEAIETVAPDAYDIGFTLPGRWRRSVADAGWAVQRGLAVRVVKGQWEDPGFPDADPRRGFMEIVAPLAGRARHVAVATHDALLARQAIERLKESATSCELELLYGLPTRHVLGVAIELDVPVRFYVPFGHAWLPYCLSQAQRNPRILLWILKDLIGSVGGRRALTR
jgi:proline dehydrogenase